VVLIGDFFDTVVSRRKRPVISPPVNIPYLRGWCVRMRRYENDKLTVSHDIQNKRAWAPCFSIGRPLMSSFYSIFLF
jgi:hypothetical protein